MCLFAFGKLFCDLDIALFPGSGEEPENKASIDNDI